MMNQLAGSPRGPLVSGTPIEDARQQAPLKEQHFALVFCTLAAAAKIMSQQILFAGFEQLANIVIISSLMDCDYSLTSLTTGSQYVGNQLQSQ
jgi:hypothetical protein